MSNDTSVRSGIDSFLIYGEETTYKTKSAALTGVFGLVTSFTPTIRRNITRRKGVRNTLPEANDEAGARDTFKLLKGNKEGEITIDFEPLNFRHLKLVMGSESGSGTAAEPYNYPQATATGANRLKYNRLPSFTISTNYLFDGTGDSADTAIDLLGAKNNTYSIRASSGEPVTCSMSNVFAKAAPDDLETGVPLPNVEPYYFVDAKVEIPGGTEFDKIITDFDLSISNNSALRHGLGSDEAQKAVVGDRDFDLNLTFDSEGVDMLKTVGYDAITEFASIVLTFERADGTKLEAHLLNVKPNEHAMQNNYPDPVQESIPFVPSMVYFVEQTTATP